MIPNCIVIGSELQRVELIGFLLIFHLFLDLLWFIVDVFWNEKSTQFFDRFLDVFIFVFEECGAASVRLQRWRLRSRCFLGGGFK